MSAWIETCLVIIDFNKAIGRTLMSAWIETS